MINNEPRSPMNLDIDATNSATMEKILYESLNFFREAIKKQIEEIMTLMRMLNYTLLSLRMKVLSNDCKT